MDGVNEPTWIEKFAAEKRRADAAEVEVRRLTEAVTEADNAHKHIRTLYDDAATRMRAAEQTAAEAKGRAVAADAAAHHLRTELEQVRKELAAAREGKPADLDSEIEIEDLRDDLEKAQMQKHELADLLLEIMAEQSFPGGPPARVAALIREALS